jgi:hypothetical protein
MAGTSSAQKKTTNKNQTCTAVISSIASIALVAQLAIRESIANALTGLRARAVLASFAANSCNR